MYMQQALALEEEKGGSVRQSHWSENVDLIVRDNEFLIRCRSTDNPYQERWTPGPSDLTSQDWEHVEADDPGYLLYNLYWSPESRFAQGEVPIAWSDRSRVEQETWTRLAWVFLREWERLGNLK